MNGREPLLPTLRDPAVDRALRESLVVLRDHTEDRDLRRSVQRVLDGDAPLRELARSEAFGALVGPLAQRGWAHWASLDEDAQERRADQGGGPPR